MRRRLRETTEGIAVGGAGVVSRFASLPKDVRVRAADYSRSNRLERRTKTSGGTPNLEEALERQHPRSVSRVPGAARLARRAFHWDSNRARLDSGAWLRWFHCPICRSETRETSHLCSTRLEV